MITVYTACRIGGIPIMLRELSVEFNDGNQRISRLYRKVATTYRLRLPPLKPEDYLEESCTVG